jgi:hypothetical protein
MVTNDTAALLVRSDALLAVLAAAQRLLDAWDAKTPLAWQPENHRALLEDLREALHMVNKEISGALTPTPTGCSIGAMARWQG